MAPTGPTPRCQHTSFTDIDLTDFGVKQIAATGRALVGSASTNLIDPKTLKMVISSPRTRALHTQKLLFESVPSEELEHVNFVVDENIREWDYGEYEGLRTAEIKDLREERGLSRDWEIWSDGCEGGEDYKQVTERVDAVISRIRDVHREAFEKGEDCNVVVIGHGHILRCFAARWVGREVNCNPQFLLDAGGVGVLSYQHHNISEPALCLAGAFVVPADETGADI
ncbi:hypothetical protein OGAPHI_006413 [Ogataea philodendri]|uniref:Sedoheptulose 1,7-bisphosphatase n=1 Tax=Ogataea philodendri TaxID=1378263 RepID=A0A9P8T151_9ASCO|nr:uncharacterized protein OGAPHI_006413 [Ogataea philodendri]KAH3661565.1 hypothetical protein OGAPHI_006413 [Ogataea philodendri]